MNQDETAVARRRRASSEPEVHSRSLRCLLDLDRELAEGFPAETLRLVRAAAVVLSFVTDPGGLPVPEWLRMTSSGPGILVLEGVLDASVRVGGRKASELIGAGDLIQPAMRDDEELLATHEEWRALTACRFALLDANFAKRVRFWPQIEHALLRRAGRRAAGLDVQRAIAGQPRLEVRLALLLWHLASRWGRTERGGVRLSLPLTHQLLGQLIGAERPSVSHALARLAQVGLVTGNGHEWHLHGELEEQIELMLAPPQRRGDLRLA